MTTDPEILIVGGGPAGSAAAFHLARMGHEVTLVERKEFPRDKTCGDGLTPRSVHELSGMGFDFTVPEFHRVQGLRSYAGELMLELEWPDHPVYPNWGGVIRRRDLDAQVAGMVEKQGAVVRDTTEARPVFQDGRVESVQLLHGGETETVRPRVLVVADGSASRFGRAVGTTRNKAYPYGLAVRGYFASPRSDDGVLESQLDVRDRDGKTIPGYGWIFPLGDGTVNVGVGLLSTASRWKGTNTSQLMEAYVGSAPGYWGLSPETALTEPVGGKLLMALSVGPRAGANWVLAGDAMGAINPFNGEGIAYAYETGRMAAHHVHAALAGGDLSLLQRYPQTLDDVYGDYYRVGRVFVRAIGNPAVMRTLARTGMRSRPLMEWVLKVMANLVDPTERGVGEQVYRLIERAVAAAPPSLAGGR